MSEDLPRICPGEAGTAQNKEEVIRGMILNDIENPLFDFKPLTIDEARSAGFTEAELRVCLLRGYVLPATSEQNVCANERFNLDEITPTGTTVREIETRAFSLITACFKDPKGILPPNFRRAKKGGNSN